MGSLLQQDRDLSIPSFYFSFSTPGMTVTPMTQVKKITVPIIKTFPKVILPPTIEPIKPTVAKYLEISKNILPNSNLL